MRNANLKTRKLNLTGRKLIDIYDTPSEWIDCKTGTEFFIDEEETVDKIYQAVAFECGDSLELNPRYEVESFSPKKSRTGNRYQIYYIDHGENGEEDYQKVSFGIYTYMDDELMLIPYSSESVKAATCISIDD